MYHIPDTSSYLAGDALSVEDILATEMTLDGAYTQLPADMRGPRDLELDAHHPWRRPAAVLRELHRQRAGEIVAGRPCRDCAEALVPELLTRVQHPSDPIRTVTLLDAMLDLAGGQFELVAAGRSLAQVVDEFVDSPGMRSPCEMPGCAGTADASEHDGTPSFSVSILGLLASWAYEVGVSRDTEAMISQAWARAVQELRDSPEGRYLTTAELIEGASTDPRIVAAEDHVPSRWADSDWGAMVRTHGESPTLCEVADALGARCEGLALCVIEVSNWLADRVERSLRG